MAKNKDIRSSHIKQLAEDKEKLAKMLEENTKTSIQSILHETINGEIRNILSEAEKDKDDDSYEVEEVDTDDTIDTEEEPNDTEDTEAEIDTEVEEPAEEGDEEEPADDIDDEVPAEDAEDDMEADDTDYTGMWDELEKYKGDDGMYDLTGMDSEEAVKVLKVMKPEDGVYVVKNDDGKIQLTDEDNDTEYIIDLEDGIPEVDTVNGTGECKGTCKESKGRRSRKVNEDNEFKPFRTEPMTTPGMEETGKDVEDWDEGAPKGKEPFATKIGDGAPFNEGVTYVLEMDEPMDEDLPETDEESAANENGVTEFGVSKLLNFSDRKGHKGANFRDRTPVKESKEIRNIKRKASAIFRENSELKSIAGEIKGKLEEAIVINASLAKIINLMTENATTRTEKLDILERFDKVKTISEGNELYKTISEELKRSHTVNQGIDRNAAIVNESKGSGKQGIVETSLYMKDETSEVLDFMRRLESVK